MTMMTRRDLNWFIAGATAMTLYVMTLLRRAKREQEDIWRAANAASETVRNMQDPSEARSEGRVVSYSPWTAELFEKPRTRNKDVR